MPTALARPCPSGPVVVSTPGVTPTSGWPGVFECSWRKCAAPRSAGRSRSGAAARTAASSRGRWTARSDRDWASADSPDCGAGAGSTARRRFRPCPSACRDGRTSRLRRRPSPARGSRWRVAVSEARAAVAETVMCVDLSRKMGGWRTRAARMKRDAALRYNLKLSLRHDNCAIIRMFSSATNCAESSNCARANVAGRASASRSRHRASDRPTGTTNGRNPSVGRMVRLPGRHAGIHAGGRAARRCASTPRATPGLTVVGERFYQFEPQGVTGTVLLAESHIAIHTWPEAGFVTVDVYVCNCTTDNTAKAEQVFRALRGGVAARAHAIPGDPSRGQGCLTARTTTPPPAGDIAPGAMTEYLTDDWGVLRPQSSRQFEKFTLAVPGGRGARHRAVRQAVPPRRPLHDVGEGRVLLSREPRPRRRRSRIRSPSAR